MSSSKYQLTDVGGNSTRTRITHLQNEDEDSVIAGMSVEPITNGWDAVCITDAEKITQLYAELYESETASNIVKNIKMNRQVPVDLIDYKIFHTFHAVVGPPLISFILNQNNLANLSMPLIRATYYVKEEIEYFDDGTIDNRTFVYTYTAQNGAFTTQRIVNNRLRRPHSRTINQDVTI